jgi:hypothetical protein
VLLLLVLVLLALLLFSILRVAQPARGGSTEWTYSWEERVAIARKSVFELRNHEVDPGPCARLAAAAAHGTTKAELPQLGLFLYGSSQEENALSSSEQERILETSTGQKRDTPLSSVERHTSAQDAVADPW